MIRGFDARSRLLDFEENLRDASLGDDYAYTRDFYLKFRKRRRVDDQENSLVSNEDDRLIDAMLEDNPL